MPSLPDELFSLLETKTLQAREAAEKAARNILAFLKLESSSWWGKKEDPQRDLWLGLRARARQLGYSVEENGEKDPVKRGLPQLVEEIAYEQWHRMLFARFLAENHLLMHPSGVAVSLAECEELAPDEGENDAWRLAARYASTMLPGIFKLEDPCAQVHLTPSDHHALETILLSIPPQVFTCDDALGWMYQFWQSKKKDEVNASERKIGGADISPVTQLFTEDYMVRFLLENSLGAWWAARHPESPLVKEWEYLRFKDDGTPAAGSFPGWPERAAEVTIMDPCCGSGHFLVAAFDMLRRMRMEEEELDGSTAAYRTLQENIFGLEIDQRCTQIAWFALSLVGWKNGGYQPLPELNIACTGIPVKGQLEDWLALAGDDSRVKAGLERLYNLFKDAPDLGSLINPADVPLSDRMFVADYEQIAPVFERVISVEAKRNEDFAGFIGYTTNNMLKATKFLVSKFTLVTTNVPFLGIRKQNEILINFCESNYSNSRHDLATVFLERCLELCKENSSIALVIPQHWIFAYSYKNLRKNILQNFSIEVINRLGTGAFKTISGEVVNISLVIISKHKPTNSHLITTIDSSDKKHYIEISETLRTVSLLSITQAKQLLNSNFMILINEKEEIELLEKYSKSLAGIQNGDSPRYQRFFWELSNIDGRWAKQQTAPDETTLFTGFDTVIDYDLREGHLRAPQKWRREQLHDSDQRGKPFWGKSGIFVNRMSNLNCALYTGLPYDQGGAVIVPIDPKNLAAIWVYCSSEYYSKDVRQIDQKLNVTSATLVKVPFDLDYWRSIAQEKFPFGLPIPFSVKPTQWIFVGKINISDEPLHVALCKLIGYRWPNQQNTDFVNYEDINGIVCLSAVNGEQLAAERLRSLLAAAYGEEWSSTKQEELLAAVGYSGKDLVDWLRDGFFEQHCKLFHNRPFIWHIWDGRKDGFSALVNYHKLDRANLEKLTYTYLGAWITDRKKELERGSAGAEGRLLAAQALQDKLKLILAGEPPYDIYVRWKPLHEQPIGWEPDLNDGVRLNIRPFVTAGVLRSKFTINWNKDRGKNPDGSERLNDLHFTVAEKQAAREKQQKTK